MSHRSSESDSLRLLLGSADAVSITCCRAARHHRRIESQKLWFRVGRVASSLSRFCVLPTSSLAKITAFPSRPARPSAAPDDLSGRTAQSPHQSPCSSAADLRCCLPFLFLFSSDVPRVVNHNQRCCSTARPCKNHGERKATYDL